jgi:ribonuclease T2
MAQGRLDISHLTLHGLWPNKASCGKTYGRCSGKDISLSAETLAYIRPWMPNAYFETAFASYQWKKHGLCQQQLDDDSYFRRAVDYVKLVNESALGAYITANIGGSIDKNKFYRLVSESLGESTRRQVQLICAGQHLQEVRIRLPRDLRPAATLKELLGDGETEAMASDGAECRGDRIAIEKSGP